MFCISGNESYWRFYSKSYIKFTKTKTKNCIGAVTVTPGWNSESHLSMQFLLVLKIMTVSFAENRWNENINILFVSKSLSGKVYGPKISAVRLHSAGNGLSFCAINNEWTSSHLLW